MIVKIVRLIVSFDRNVSTITIRRTYVRSDPSVMNNIGNKIVLVTGGANGIGFACCEEFLRNGAAHVAILDLKNSNGEEVASGLNDDFGEGKVIFFVCDVTKPEELEAGFAKTVEEFGGLDVVVNNAGIADERQWEKMIDVNYTAIVRATLLGLWHMGKDKGGKGGTIVNVSSIGGVVPIAHFPIYSGTKHAVVGLTRSLALPYHHEKTGVRLLAICPGSTDTRLLKQRYEEMIEEHGAEVTIKAFEEFPVQSVENVVEGLLHAFLVGENGSIWVVDRGEPIYEIEVADYPVKKIPDS